MDKVELSLWLLFGPGCTLFVQLGDDAEDLYKERHHAQHRPSRQQPRRRGEPSIQQIANANEESHREAELHTEAEIRRCLPQAFLDAAFLCPVRPRIRRWLHGYRARDRELSGLSPAGNRASFFCSGNLGIMASFSLVGASLEVSVLVRSLPSCPI